MEVNTLGFRAKTRERQGLHTNLNSPLYGLHDPCAMPFLFRVFSHGSLDSSSDGLTGT
jgi:hypothetical protein